MTKKAQFINPMAIKVQHSTVEVFLTVKKEQVSTGLVLELRHQSDPVVKAMDTAIRKDGFKAKAAGADPMEHALDHMEQRLDDRTIAHVAGWAWKEGVDPQLAKLAYSEKQLREFLAAVPFGDAIRNAVFEHLKGEEHFFVMPAVS